MSNTKNFTIFAGSNGAGKSTLFYSEDKTNLGVRINTDEIIHDLNLDWHNLTAQIEAGKKALQIQKDCLDKGISFNQETTLTGYTIISTIKKAKELGYSIHLRYVGVETPEIAKERVAKRVAHGGHGVSENTIDKRFKTSRANLLKILPLCDSVNIYDNSGSSMVLVAHTINHKLKKTKTNCEWLNTLLKNFF